MSGLNVLREISRDKPRYHQIVETLKSNEMESKVDSSDSIFIEESLQGMAMMFLNVLVDKMSDVEDRISFRSELLSDFEFPSLLNVSPLTLVLALF